MTAKTNSQQLPATPKQRDYLSALMREVYTPQQVAEYMRNLTKSEASAAISKMKAAGVKTGRERSHTSTRTANTGRRRQARTVKPEPFDHEDCLSFGPCGASCHEAFA